MWTPCSKPGRKDSGHTHLEYGGDLLPALGFQQEFHSHPVP